METRAFARTGWDVSRLGLGTYFLTSDRGVPHREAVAVVRRALALGVNLVDTAPLYGRGEAEQIVGEALSDTEGHCRIIEKVGNFECSILAPVARQSYRDADYIRIQFEHSLRVLGRQSVDLLLVHEADWDEWWGDGDLAKAPVVAVLETLKHEGLAEHIGVSARNPVAAAALCESGLFDAILYVHYFNLVWQEAGETVLSVAASMGMGTAVGAVYRQGLLIDPDIRTLARLRMEHRADVPPGIISRIEGALRIAREAGMSLPELGLRFLLGHPYVGTVLVGPRTVLELEENVEWAERGPLPAELHQMVVALRETEIGAWTTSQRVISAASSEFGALREVAKGAVRRARKAARGPRRW
jgi:aryl-alcohol dehydrogenase-like predicted oxidoreductase